MSDFEKRLFCIHMRSSTANRRHSQFKSLHPARTVCLGDVKASTGPQPGCQRIRTGAQSRYFSRLNEFETSSGQSVVHEQNGNMLQAALKVSSL